MNKGMESGSWRNQWTCEFNCLNFTRRKKQRTQANVALVGSKIGYVAPRHQIQTIWFSKILLSRMMVNVIWVLYSIAVVSFGDVLLHFYRYFHENWSKIGLSQIVWIWSREGSMLPILLPTRVLNRARKKFRRVYTAIHKVCEVGSTLTEKFTKIYSFCDYFFVRLRIAFGPLLS